MVLGVWCLVFLATFAGVLAGLIGDRLVLSLLQELWPDALRAEIGPPERDE